MMRLIGIFVLMLFACISGVMAGEMKHEPYRGSDHFQQLVGLVGEWEGTQSMSHNGDNSVAVTYELTSNGSAVVETLFPGSPMEMVSIYHDEGDKVVMTHYCGLGNQPKMELAKVDEGQYHFEFSNDNVINPQTEDHMHSLALNIVDENNITHVWSFHQGGKEADSNEMTLARV